MTLICGYIGKAKDFKPLNFVVKGHISLKENAKEVKDE